MNLHNTIKNSVQHKRRIDCPRCGGNLTLSITKENGVIKYNCYKAACDTKGILNVNRTKEEMSNLLLKHKDKAVPPFVTPSHIVNGLGSIEATSWAKDNNVLHAYESNKINLCYDPKLNRLVFYLKDLNNHTVGLIGRSLVANNKPKWLVYPYSTPATPFICGKGSTLIMVEDCASACSVSRVKDCTGMALLGTEFLEGYIPYIKNYSEIIICLDDDAKRKAVAKLRQRIEMVANMPVSVMFTKEDLKKLTQVQLEEMISYVNTR